jgi:hypothetical protein
MRRRTFLTTVVTSGAAAVAGCIGTAIPGGESVDGGGNGDTDGTGNGTAEGDVTVTDARLAVENVECGTVTDEASVAREAAESRVVVEGTISAPNPCYTATLGDETYDAEAGELRVPVSTEKRPDTDVCAQCIAEIAYRVVVTMAGGLPVAVVVSHGDEVVTEASG